VPASLLHAFESGSISFSVKMEQAEWPVAWSDIFRTEAASLLLYSAHLTQNPSKKLLVSNMQRL
jgi:hypothetical protein